MEGVVVIQGKGMVSVCSISYSKKEWAGSPAVGRYGMLLEGTGGREANHKQENVWCVVCVCVHRRIIE